ncbi:hypothetical protein JCM19231_3214 [Vibrio ishigakensis]|uniref:Periplasmic ATP/GTP-binding protein n=1 Tax=Vibrio ishigakensis TaxID=1481914 RepID=A0A0B8NWV2_9VIBR|nr:hypothetical protein [Vibrio ishigakensis]GAM59025.1 hypothetical protein JCM19231_3214 [Vibrio ishigakensis]
MFKQAMTTLLLSAAIISTPVFADNNQASDVNIDSVISMPVGHFFENLTYLNDQELITSDYTGQSLYKYNEQGLASLWAKVDGHPVSIRFDEKGQGLLAVHEMSILEGADFVNHMALYKVSNEGKLTRLMGLDTPAFLNGMVYLGEQQYLISDAANGKIYRFDMASNELSTWFEDELLQPLKDRPGLPGINGMQLYKGAIYFTNSAQQLLGKINIDGNQATKLETVEKGIQADDFIIDEQGTWFITTHHHEIIKYTADKEKSVVLNHGVEGSTAIQISNQDPGYFYITNDGGLLFGGTDHPGLHKVQLK